MAIIDTISFSSFSFYFFFFWCFISFSLQKHQLFSNFSFYFHYNWTDCALFTLYWTLSLARALALPISFYLYHFLWHHTNARFDPESNVKFVFQLWIMLNNDVGNIMYPIEFRCAVKYYFISHHLYNGGIDVSCFPFFVIILCMNVYFPILPWVASPFFFSFNVYSVQCPMSELLNEEKYEKKKNIMRIMYIQCNCIPEQLFAIHHRLRKKWVKQTIN